MAVEIDDASVKWCSDELSKILNCPPSEEIVRYILSIDEKSELEEFLEHVLGETNSTHQSFVDKLLKHQKLTKLKKESGGDFIYKKPEESNYIEGKTKSKNKHKSKPESVSGHGYSANGHEKPAYQEQSVKKKAHYVPLFGEGTTQDAIILPGRHPCNCEATKHQLVNNCLQCGRIACKQEGSGPCLTCGAMICTAEEQEILLRGSKKSAKLHEKLMNIPNAEQDEQLKRAIEHKNKLLDFNRTSARRTQIIDDESDYFSLDANKWMTKDQRKIMTKKVQELHEKRHARASQTVTFDIAGRRVIEGEAYNYQSDVDELKSLAASFSSLKFKGEEVTPEMKTNINPTLDVPAPTYEPSRNSLFSNNVSMDRENKWHQPIRLQDRELQEITDEGMCLSMHQPWASLLVMGIKRHEGRTWYSHYRGSLWIHAASKVPTPEEVNEVEQAHRIINGDHYVMFPEQYPVGCLLGCVALEECLPQEEYRSKYPDGESISPYVMICENPQELFLKFPMKGKHKIFKLDKNIHQAAKNTLRKLVNK